MSIVDELSNQPSRESHRSPLILGMALVIIGLCVVVYRDWRRERLLEYIIADTRSVMMYWYHCEAICQFNCNNSDEQNKEVQGRYELFDGARRARDQAEVRLKSWW